MGGAMMTSYIQILICTAVTLYITSAVVYFWAVRKSTLGKIALSLAAVGFVSNLLALGIQSVVDGRLPLTTGYEFLMIFTCITVFMYIIYEIKSGFRKAGGAVMLIAALLLLSAAISVRGQSGITSPLMPALKSPWLTVHVLTAAAAYSGFALAAGLALMQLCTASSAQEKSVYRIVSVSFALLSLSIVLGAIWAEQAWGSYWSWDPKETWALITWIVYAVYLHLHRQKQWRGKPANILVIAGFIIVLFTFFGVNFFLSGLHSYA